MCIGNNIFIIILQLTATQMYRHHKPLTEKIWSERCIKNSVVLNDCNWCRCNSRQKYDCAARVCEEIDTFGHFKDAIQEIDVGMEGRGSWRSKPTSCTPGVHYRRGAILCVCDEDGNWPSPICRDLFQILHTVEITGQTALSQNESCNPTKLYLVGCNVCFCPSSGYFDPKLCTNNECQEDDPALKPTLQEVSSKNVIDADEDLEIYATCNPEYRYELGCRTCDCLRTNRLICDNCSTTDEYVTSLTKRTEEEKRKSICDRRKPLKVFYIRCNLCHCSKQKNLFCTVKKCYSKTNKLISSFKLKSLSTDLRQVREPFDDENCTPGTKFKRECNHCVCDIQNGVKYVKCTRAMCSKNLIHVQNNDCVNGTFYEENCMLCHCYIKDKVKYQICRLNKRCVRNAGSQILVHRELRDVNLLRGYCEPMRQYKRDCNICRCLTDAKTVECTSEICIQRSSDALSVDVVPVEVEYGGDCPKGHSFQLDCNICFCLSNGNAMCTTAMCSNQNI